MNQKYRSLHVLALTAALTSAGAVTYAQTPAAQAPAAAPAAKPAQDRYIVGQAKPPEVAGQAAQDITLDQAIQRALDRNIDLKVARFNPQLTDYQIRQTRAAYMPTFTQQTQYRDATSLTNSTSEGDQLDYATRQISSTTGVQQTTPWRGLSYNFNFQTFRQTSTLRIATRPLSYNSSLTFNATQPLLRNFRTDNTRTTLLTQQITRDINDITLKTTIANTIAQVRNAYWDLRSAIENIEIQRRALALATTLVEQNRAKVEIGTMAQIDVVTAESQQANAELNLVNAESTWRTAELTFKRLVAGGTEDDIFRATVNPSDVPAVGQANVDIPGAVKQALTLRTDLATAKKNIESANLNIELLKNQVLPDLNLTGGYSVSGAAGTLYARNPQTGAMELSATTGYFSALSSAFDVPTWNISANFTYPLFQVASRANLARTRLQLEQTTTQLRSTELTVTTDVTNAGLAVQNAYKSLLASQKAGELAARQAEAEQTKFDVGMSTNFTVVQQQQALTSARLAELRALITYVKALIEFERVQNVGR